MNVRINRHGILKLHCAQMLVDTLMLMLSFPMRILPTIQNERIFVASVCTISLTFVSIFQSSLATVFIKPIFYKNIDSLEDLDKSGMKIYTNSEDLLVDAFSEGYYSETFDHLRKRLEYKKFNTMDLSKIFVKNKAYLTRKSVFELQWMTPNAKSHLMKECPREYRLSYMVSKNSAGLIDNSINFAKFNASIAHLKTQTHPPKLKVLTTHDLQLPFIILIIGTLVSSLVFVFELFTKMKRKQK